MENKGQLERLIEAIEKLTEAVCVRAQASMNLTEAVKEQVAVKEEPVKEEPVKEEPVKEEPVKEEPVKEEPKKEITLELLRKILIDKRGRGKGPEVAALVKSYGVNSLDKIPTDKYIEIYAKAEAIV